MKIEVGKTYRTRDGQRIEITRPVEYKDDFYKFRDNTPRAWSADGRYYESAESDSDLISEWTDEPAAVAVNYTSTSESTLAVNAAPKYRAGDLVTIRLSAGDENYLNAGVAIEIRREEIISHTPAPEPAFDWKDVKPGMAFKERKSGRTCWYVGPSYAVPEEMAIVGYSRDGSGYRSEWLKYLTRAPEHDIEVAE